MFEIGQQVRVVGESTTGLVKAFIKKGRWEYVTIGLADETAKDFRPAMLRKVDTYNEIVADVDAELAKEALKMPTVVIVPKQELPAPALTKKETLIPKGMSIKFTPAIDEGATAEQQLQGLKDTEAPPSQPKPKAEKRLDPPGVVTFINLDLEAAYTSAADILNVNRLDLVERYKKLNPGMQKMNLTNRVRAAYKKEVK